MGAGGGCDFVTQAPVSPNDMVQVNVVAHTQRTRLLVPHMVERRCGMALNPSSVAAFSAGL